MRVNVFVDRFFIHIDVENLLNSYEKPDDPPLHRYPKTEEHNRRTI